MSIVDQTNLGRGDEMGVIYFQAAAAFDPLTLTWDRYYDYSDATSVTTATGISQINDQSGNDGHAVQGTGTNQPAYTLAAQNGLNVATFDGAGDRLVDSSLTVAQPTMFFLVAKISTVAAAAQFMMTVANASSMTLYKVVTSSFWTYYAGASVVSSAVVADTNWHVFCARFNGASSYIMLDGVQIATGNPGTAGATASTFSMGGTTTGSSSFNGQMGFAAIGLQSDANRDAMVNHLKSKWAIA